LGEAVILQATPRGQVILTGPFTASVQTGDVVRQGQALGQAADRGGAVRLYIELRDLGQPIDPQPWLRSETP
jgi:septal ring factor EnvC (AmiA/AmiB activator)